MVTDSVVTGALKPYDSRMLPDCVLPETRLSMY